MFTFLNKLKGLHWGLVEKLKNENLFFSLLSTCVSHSSLPCCTLKCRLSVGNSFKSCFISFDLEKLFFSCSTDTFQSLTCCQIHSRHIRYYKISFDTPNTLVTKNIGFRNFLFKCVTWQDFSGVPLNPSFQFGDTFSGWFFAKSIN